MREVRVVGCDDYVTWYRESQAACIACGARSVPKDRDGYCMRGPYRGPGPFCSEKRLGPPAPTIVMATIPYEGDPT